MAIIFHYKLIKKLTVRLKNTGRVEYKREGLISIVIKIKMTVTVLYKVINLFGSGRTDLWMNLLGTVMRVASFDYLTIKRKVYKMISFMKLNDPSMKITEIWKLKWDVHSTGNKEYLVEMETVFSPVRLKILNSKTIKKKKTPKNVSTSGKIILPLINFKSWAHIEFVIKEAVKRSPNKSLWFQIYHRLKWSDHIFPHTGRNENLYLKHVSVATSVSFNTSFGKYFKVIEPRKSVWD